MHVDRIGIEIVRKWLLDVENVLENLGLVGLQPIEDLVDVLRIGNGTVEIGTQDFDVVSSGNFADADQASIVPRPIVAAKLHLEAGQAVLADPIDQRDRMAVVGLIPLSVRIVQRIEAAHQMPGLQPAWGIGNQKIDRIRAL